MRILALTSLLLATLSVTPARAQTSDKRKVRHQVQQAILYLKMKIPQRSMELLTKLTKDPPGRRDPVAWLALSRVQFVQQNLDESGLAFLRAQELGIQDELETLEPWAPKFHKQFVDTIGSLRVRAPCDAVEFAATPASAVVDSTQRALLNSVQGWRQKSLIRSTLQPFFLPKGKYKFGENGTVVAIESLDQSSIDAREIGARCQDLPGAVLIDNAAVAGQDSFMERTWYWWALGGLAVVAGGTAAAFAASRGSDEPAFGFRFR